MRMRTLTVTVALLCAALLCVGGEDGGPACQGAPCTQRRSARGGAHAGARASPPALVAADARRLGPAARQLRPHAAAGAAAAPPADGWDPTGAKLLLRLAGGGASDGPGDGGGPGAAAGRDGAEESWDAEESKAALIGDDGKDPASAPPSSVGPLSLGERTVLESLRRLSLERQASTLGKLAADTPETVRRFRESGRVKEEEWAKWEEAMAKQMHKKMVGKDATDGSNEADDGDDSTALPANGQLDGNVLETDGDGLGARCETGDQWSDEVLFGEHGEGEGGDLGGVDEHQQAPGRLRQLVRDQIAAAQIPVRTGRPLGAQGVMLGADAGAGVHGELAGRGGDEEEGPQAAREAAGHGGTVDVGELLRHVRVWNSGHGSSDI